MPFESRMQMHPNVGKGIEKSIIHHVLAGVICFLWHVLDCRCLCQLNSCSFAFLKPQVVICFIYVTKPDKLKSLTALWVYLPYVAQNQVSKQERWISAFKGFSLSDVRSNSATLCGHAACRQFTASQAEKFICHGCVKLQWSAVFWPGPVRNTDPPLLLEIKK